MAEILGSRVEERRDVFDPSLVELAERGRSVSAVETYRVRQRMARLYDDMATFFERFDLLVTPTAAALPWTLDREYPSEIDGQAVGPRGHAAFTPFANYAGLPAISVPAGWTDFGLPVGLQIAGPYLSDELVLRTAASYEEAFPWSDRWPVLPG